MDLASLIEQYGYAAVLAGCLLEGETVLALAGLSAHRGYLALPWVIVIATFGGFIGDQFYFFLGRRFGPRLVSHYPQLQPGIARVDALLDRRCRDLAGRCRVALEDLQRLAEGCRGDLPLAKHNPRAHEARPALDVSRRVFQAIRQAIDHRSDCRILPTLRHRMGLGIIFHT